MGVRRNFETLRIFGGQPNRVGAKLGPANRAACPGCGFRTCKAAVPTCRDDALAREISCCVGDKPLQGWAHDAGPQHRISGPPGLRSNERRICGATWDQYIHRDAAASQFRGPNCRTGLQRRFGGAIGQYAQHGAEGCGVIDNPSAAGRTHHGHGRTRQQHRGRDIKRFQTGPLNSSRLGSRVSASGRRLDTPMPVLFTSTSKRSKWEMAAAITASHPRAVERSAAMARRFGGNHAPPATPPSPWHHDQAQQCGARRQLADHSAGLAAPVRPGL